MELLLQRPLKGLRAETGVRDRERGCCSGQSWSTQGSSFSFHLPTRHSPFGQREHLGDDKETAVLPALLLPSLGKGMLRAVFVGFSTQLASYLPFPRLSVNLQNWKPYVFISLECSKIERINE